MERDIENFFLARREPLKSALLALRSTILGFDENISETVKYGMPCYLYRRNVMCYLWVDRKTALPYILMAEGNRLHDHRLEKGGRSRMKALVVYPERDLPVEAISDILTEAVSLYRNGVVKLK